MFGFPAPPAALEKMVRRMVPATVLMAAALALAPAVPAEAQIMYDPPQPLDGIAVVIDGDRLNVNGLPVRLYGIDAPDLGQFCLSARGRSYDCGAVARDMLERLIGTRQVQCSIFSVLTNDDQVGACAVDGHDLAAAMVIRGWAFPVPSLATRYESLESRAQSARAGVWSGRAERPWNWRRRQGAEPDR